jgi:hypothetical protein
MQPGRRGVVSGSNLASRPGPRRPGWTGHDQRRPLAFPSEPIEGEAQLTVKLERADLDARSDRVLGGKGADALEGRLDFAYCQRPARRQRVIGAPAVQAGRGP